MKLHQIKSQIEAATGLRVLGGDNSLDVLVTGNCADLVGPTAAALRNAGIPFNKKPKGKRFAGATFCIPVENIGSTFQADWVFA